MIRLEDVTKRFDDVAAVRGFSFEVAAGESVALIGPSGSGKTTVLRLIAGLDVPDQGRILLNGRLVSRAGWACPPHERGAGMVFQKPALWPHLTVEGNVRFGLDGLRRDAAESRLRDILRVAQLEGLEHRYPDQLSGGEAQRVALARAVAPRPDILLLDEPMAGLDPDLVRQIAGLIRAVRTEMGTTIVYVSHHHTEAALVTDRVVTMRAGALTGALTWEDVRAREARG